MKCVVCTFPETIIVHHVERLSSYNYSTQYPRQSSSGFINTLERSIPVFCFTR